MVIPVMMQHYAMLQRKQLFIQGTKIRRIARISSHT